MRTTEIFNEKTPEDFAKDWLAKAVEIPHLEKHLFEIEHRLINELFILTRLPISFSSVITAEGETYEFLSFIPLVHYIREGDHWLQGYGYRANMSNIIREKREAIELYRGLLASR